MNLGTILFIGVLMSLFVAFWIWWVYSWVSYIVENRRFERDHPELFR